MSNFLAPGVCCVSPSSSSSSSSSSSIETTCACSGTLPGSVYLRYVISGISPRFERDVFRIYNCYGVEYTVSQQEKIESLGYDQLNGTYLTKMVEPVDCAHAPTHPMTDVNYPVPFETIVTLSGGLECSKSGTASVRLVNGDLFMYGLNPEYYGTPGFGAYPRPFQGCDPTIGYFAQTITYNVNFMYSSEFFTIVADYVIL